MLKQLTGLLAINFLTLGLVKLEMQPARAVIIGQRPTTNSSPQFKEPLFNAPPPPPSDVDKSGNRSSGLPRGCEDVANQSTGSEQKLLTALVPVYQIKDSTSVFGLTVSANPTLWFYVPYQSTSSGNFVLYDGGSKPVYEVPFKLSGKPGVVQISLPSSVSLQIDRQYQWYFNIYCEPRQPAISVSGNIRRVNFSNPALKSQLEKATVSDRISILAANGIWYDALTAAGELRQTAPNDGHWPSLLRQIGLSNIASEPIVECCKTEN
ncbi:DUF928 domain-containing protein [Tychonema sp. BBK16]|uniref:DUF928 domain-containing protein n=1 Tax=Tychonema sp. BBK16 TaxID=2699888 RepID=UPI001F238910|nr:DUF928 domain-containing protein [Tychonema sp. BBK16]MCF6372197.1 DUF928 domain-containing protein [Tychonema sp. BBK16]